jgi:uncharacterized SAM-binding protein YcdF (DUF218 family)
METYLVKIAGALLLPPASSLLLAALGWAARRRRPRLGAVLLALGWGSLVALSLPPVSHGLYRGLQPHPALDPGALPAAEAIVVLCGGRYPRAPEYGGDTLSERSLVRARYGARLHRLTGLPVLVSGGAVFKEGPPEALLMRAVLEEDFRVPVAWVESESRNTEENAVLSSRILTANGVRRFFLVSETGHMTRALAAFRSQGLEPVPAPTRFQTAGDGPAVLGWLPSADALEDSSEALYAYLAEAWYGIRYR